MSREEREAKPVHGVRFDLHGRVVDSPMRMQSGRVSCFAMSAPPRRRIAFILLLAALAQPAWAVAHADIHEHLAQHHGEATHHPPVIAHDAHGSGTKDLAATERAHHHDHEHLVAVFLRPTRNADTSSMVALPSAAPRPHAVVTGQRLIDRDPSTSRASPEQSGPSEPRAPPIV